MKLLNAKHCADELGMTIGKLQRMARAGEFPELLRVSRGEFRVSAIDYESWKAARWTSAEMAREALQFERDKAKLSGRV